jgi:hypothetical protein
MAAVIHCLWERGDRNPLILPSTIPIDDPRVQFELTRYLSDNWVPVIEKDVDGPGALPLRIDSEVPTLGQHQACRRVARTIYLGSAPMAGAAHMGIEDRRIKLGCVMPGETPAIFGDALRRLAGAATYLYQDGARYWYATQPTVTKLADDRAEQLRRDPGRVAKEIEGRVRNLVRNPGDFSRVHPFPQSSQDVPDDYDARLVVLRPDQPHARGSESPALTAARQILETRGSAPRLRRNTLVFLAADSSRLQDLEEAVRRYLAWDSILSDKETLNLTPHQVRQAEDQREAADKTVEAQIPETYQWLLVPVQENPQADISWQTIRLAAQEPLAKRASKKLCTDELLVLKLGATRLRMAMDDIPLWRGDHVEIRQLIEDFSRYLYLPRLKHPSALVNAVQEGLALFTWEGESFAYAESYDEASGRYRGLRAGQQISLPDQDPPGLLVQPAVARRQMEAETPQVVSAPVSPTVPPTYPQPTPVQEISGTEAPARPAVTRPRRFHGSVKLDSTRAGRDAGRVAEEVIAHLAGLPGAQVSVTLEIEAHLPNGVPDHIIRTVTENSQTLKFSSHGFEDE